MTFPSSVYIREVGPREGFQTHKSIIATAVKLELIRLLGLSGVKEIEITSLVRPDLVPQMADAEELIQKFEAAPDVRYTALYLNKKGYERAAAMKRINNLGWLYAATSATFLKKNSNTSIAEIQAAIPEWLSLFQSHGTPLHGLMISTAFGCAYEGAVSTAQAIAVIRPLIAAIAAAGGTLSELSLADTVGLGNPRSIQDLVKAAQDAWPNIEISLHLHDTRGTGIANVYAGLLAGVRIFDSSIGGLGGCPFTPGAAGNVSTEDVVYLCESLGIDTGIRLDALLAANSYLAQMLQSPLNSKYAASQWRCA